MSPSDAWAAVGRYTGVHDSLATDHSALIDALGIDTSKPAGRIPCPAHGDGRKLTLSYRLNGRTLLLHCFAGCTFDQIRAAAG